MRRLFILLATRLILFASASGQTTVPAPANTPIPLSAYAGDYGTGDSTIFSIILRDGHLFFNTPHYGKIGLIPLPDHRFKLQNVKPEAFINFIPDSLGRIGKMVLRQEGKFTWIKMQDTARSSRSQAGTSDIPGKYRQDIDIYSFISITAEGGQLKNGFQPLSPIGANRFSLKDSTRDDVYDFIRDKQGRVQKLVVTSVSFPAFNKRPPGPGNNGLATGENGGSSGIEHISNRANGFTRADSMQGMLTPIRTCYDVLFYDLNASIDLETKSVHGNTVIRFRTMAAFDSIQVDLYASMKIEKILFHDQELSYSRQYNAVYIRFPVPPAIGSIEEINIFYAGQPQIPEYATLKGGFFWFQNKNGNPWIESVCQGSGASLWWPCKDHLSDKPDSMKISITVPSGLTDLSNGRLMNKIDLPGHLTRFDWYVSYPINTYNVVVNIGNYAHFADTYIRGKDASAGQDTLALNYYCMPYNLEKARQLFRNVKPMLTLYEKNFGPYPFEKDGFTLMESLYPMEHQGAVSIGPINNPVLSDKWDSADLFRTALHESAHEWWGNSITCSDYADLWIHEAFATYAEMLAYEFFSGKEAALKYLQDQHPGNKEPIIGIYHVNNFHLGDMYSKGCLMLNTLRNVIDDDSCWFGILKGIQEYFRYRSVTTEDIVGYFNQATKKDYTAFFDQYLRHAAIPELALTLQKDGQDLQVRYKWNTEVKGFDMPVKVTTGKNSFSFIYPTADWQSLKVQNMKTADFKVDRDDFYITLTKMAPSDNR